MADSLAVKSANYFMNAALKIPIPNLPNGTVSLKPYTDGKANVEMAIA